MDFAHVGKHCSMPQCRQQDFLPFQCDFCGEVHCQDHRRPDDHDCKKGGYASVDDNFVILCPICHFRISMRGATAAAVNKMGGGGPQTPDELWNKHVDSGECHRQQQENKRQEKPTQCQHQGCKKKMTYISRYQCGKCGIYTCLEHRYEDAHNCGKKAQSVTYQQTKHSKLLQPGYFNRSKPVQQQNSQMAKPVSSSASVPGGYTPLRAQPKPTAASPSVFSTQPPAFPGPSSAFSANANQIPDQLEACPLCPAVFRSVDLLIEHSMTHHQEGSGQAAPKKKAANDTEKCPECFKRFNVVELVAHMQQEHFIF